MIQWIMALKLYFFVPVKLLLTMSSQFMESDQAYDDIQETKTAFVISLLIAIYGFSVILKSFAVHLVWKEVCGSIGFLIVLIVTIILLKRMILLYKSSRNTLEDSQ